MQVGECSDLKKVNLFVGKLNKNNIALKGCI